MLTVEASCAYPAPELAEQPCCPDCLKALLHLMACVLADAPSQGPSAFIEQASPTPAPAAHAYETLMPQSESPQAPAPQVPAQRSL